MSDTAEAVVRDYYAALRRGDPLSPYFLESESTVKFGISEALFGFDEVCEALHEQTETTGDWTVESSRLVVADRGANATFADDVRMAWTDTTSDEEYDFETRWSGTLVRRDDADGSTPVTTGESKTAAATTGEAGDDDRPDWLFASMHVSAPHDL
ncbi:nuclear transport factor 2 family protein [Halosolutus amylolyticus]|uniref:Nuclear transport factor 2 family protein n=1 Tax=Halosolutus amylolyticus TaxID=2932267 RepID=A0ABD5PTW5_9EURY|nr:nuclear transport factor 2 family protein [Halosolutus amylolyticus]